MKKKCCKCRQTRQLFPGDFFFSQIDPHQNGIEKIIAALSSELKSQTLPLSFAAVIQTVFNNSRITAGNDKQQTQYMNCAGPFNKLF